MHTPAIGNSHFCPPVKLTSKAQWTAVTLVAVAAIAALTVGLGGYFSPAGSLLSGLGSVGTHTLIGVGGSGSLITLVLLSCQGCKRHTPNASGQLLQTPPSSPQTNPLPQSVVVTRSGHQNSGHFVPASLTETRFDSEDESDGSGSGGSMVVKEGVKSRGDVLEINWNDAGKSGSLRVLGNRSSTYSFDTQDLSEIFKSLEATEEEIAPDVETFKERFLTNAQELVRDRTAALKTGEPKLNKTQLAILADAKKHIRKTRQDEDVTLHASGTNIVFEVDGLPGFIFKVSKENSKEKAEVEEYVRLRTTARELCAEEGLFMIRIPACSFVKIKGEYVIVEERVPGLIGEFYFQQSLYEWGVAQSDLHDYFHELFRQQVIFISTFGFGDVKYDNIPLNMKGQLVLIDLDNWGALPGLTQGFNEAQSEGLFSYIPAAWQEKFVSQATSLLFSTSLARAAERGQFRKDYLAFLGEKTVQTPVAYTAQNDSKPEILAAAFCKLFNDRLTEVHSCDPAVGRRLQIDFHVTGDFWKSLKNQFSGYSPRRFFREGEIDESFIGNVPLALTLLKEQGIIFDFEYRNGAPEAVIYA